MSRGELERLRVSSWPSDLGSWRELAALTTFVALFLFIPACQLLDMGVVEVIGVFALAGLLVFWVVVGARVGALVIGPQMYLYQGGGRRPVQPEEILLRHRKGRWELWIAPWYSSYRIFATRDEQRAWNIAERIARALRIPLRDESGGDSVARAPVELDRPLLDWIAATASIAPPPPCPRGLDVVDQGATLVLHWWDRTRRCKLTLTDTEVTVESSTAPSEPTALRDIEIIRLVSGPLATTSLHFVGDRHILRVRVAGPPHRAGWMRHKIVHWLHQRARAARAAGPYR